MATSRITIRTVLCRLKPECRHPRSVRIKAQPPRLLFTGTLDTPPAGFYTCLTRITCKESTVSTSVSVRLPDEAAKALEELARTTERSKTSLILKALEAYLADYAEYQIALDRLRDKDDPVISTAELRKRLGRQG